MAQKVNPISLRLNLNRSYDSCWFDQLQTLNAINRDLLLRKYFSLYFQKTFNYNCLCRVKITHAPQFSNLSFYYLYPIDLKSKSKSKFQFQSKSSPSKKFNSQFHSLSSLSKKIVLNRQFLKSNSRSFPLYSPFQPYSISYFAINNYLQSANALALWLVYHLQRRNPVQKLFQQISKSIASSPFLEGIRIRCCGRLTNKEKATTSKFDYGRVPTHAFSSSIDFASQRVNLKSGTVGIKVWITYIKPKSTKNKPSKHNIKKSKKL